MSKELIHDRLIQADQIQAEPIEWIWQNYLAEGTFELLSAPPGTGKTTIAIHFAACITTGKAWPDGTLPNNIGDVIIWSDEDSYQHVLVPRLIAAGANLSRVHFLELQDVEDPNLAIKTLFSQWSSNQVKLIIIDSVMALVRGDSNKSSDVRNAINWLKPLAEKNHCAILGITHFTKGTANAPIIERVTGSIAFAAMARIVLSCGQSNDNDSSMLLIAKSNIGQSDIGVKYRILPTTITNDKEQIIETTVIEWTNVVTQHASKVMYRLNQPNDQRINDHAINALRSILLDTEDHDSNFIKQKMKNLGFSDKQTNTARQHLNVTSDPIPGQGNKREWYLPESI